MGEANRRKKNDPYFGMRPKNGRGVLLSVPISVEESKISTLDSSIEPSELRRAVLFWDRLVWPDSRIISFASNSDEETLEKEGILTRPRPVCLDVPQHMNALIRSSGGSTISLSDESANLFSNEHVQTYIDLEQKEKGQWMLSEGESSFMLKTQNFVAGRGQAITLARAIPLPSSNMPIPELLEFKLKRRDEIVALTHELDRFYTQIANANDSEFELARLLRVVDKHCADMISVSREAKQPFRLGSLSCSLSFDSVESAVKRAAACDAFTRATTGLPIVGGLLGAASSFVSFSPDFGMRKSVQSSSPYRVVTQMHQELI